MRAGCVQRLSLSRSDLAIDGPQQKSPMCIFFAPFMPSPAPALLTAFFQELRIHGIPAAILHGFEEMPTHWESDVDFVVPANALPRLAGIQRSVAEAHGWLLVDVIEANLDARYAVLVEKENPGHWLQLDACADYVERQHRLVPAQKLLAGARDGECLPTATPEAEAAYLIAKAVLKRGALTSRTERLKHLLRLDPAGLERAFEAVVGTTGRTLAEWLAEKADQQRELAERLHRRKRFGILDWMREGWRALRRIARPSGLHLSFFGPDGVGKSTLLTALPPLLTPCFRRIVHFHFRPRVFEKAGGPPVTDPHSQPPRGRIVCALKLLYYFFDHWLGYFLKVLPAKIRAEAVIFDRGFEDVLVDPTRYRLRGVSGLARCLAALLPSPDLTFVLEAPPDVIHQRKTELPLAEIGRQQAALRSLAEGHSRWRVVSADQPPEQLTRVVSAEIFRFLAARCACRHPAGNSRPSSP